jgi:putative acetyltransferase
MNDKAAALQIRPYLPADERAVLDLFVRVNRELAPNHLRDDFERYIALSIREEIARIPEYYDRARGRSFWTATESETVVGMFGLEPSPVGTIELRRMYVDPSCRRRGYATTMLRRAEEIAQAAGFSKMVLSTSEVQQAALALYRNARFTLLKDAQVMSSSNKTVGGGIRRYYFEKSLNAGDVQVSRTASVSLLDSKSHLARMRQR